MSGPDRPIQPENRREASRWVAIVHEDIDVATAAANLSRLGASAYPFQQAVARAGLDLVRRIWTGPTLGGSPKKPQRQRLTQ
jgi:hypothetical protein